jgi:hypothetical protein
MLAEHVTTGSEITVATRDVLVVETHPVERFLEIV